jgi:hypothetical protein
VLEKILNKLGYYKRVNGNSYREIRYHELGTPKEKSERLLKLTTDGHGWIQERTKEDYQFIGTFFTNVLLIEYKLSQLLIGFEPEIERKMFGRKIEVYKDFLKAYQPEEDEDVGDYHNLISPLKDIKKLRDAMAHDITKSKFAYKDIKHIENYVSKMRPDLFNGIKDCTDEDAKSMGVILIFGFIFAVEIAKLRMSIA